MKVLAKKKSKKKKKLNVQINLAHVFIITVLIVAAGVCSYFFFYGNQEDPIDALKTTESAKKDKDNQPKIQQDSSGKGLTNYKSIRQQPINIQHETSIDGQAIMLESTISYPANRKKAWVYTNPTTLQLKLLAKDYPENYKVYLYQVNAQAYTVADSDVQLDHLTVNDTTITYDQPGLLDHNNEYQLPLNITELTASKEAIARRLSASKLQNDVLLKTELKCLKLEVLWTLQVKNITTGDVYIKTLQDIVQFNS